MRQPQQEIEGIALTVKIKVKEVKVKGKDKKKGGGNVYTWVKNKPLSFKVGEWPVVEGPKNSLTPLEYFELFFDEVVYDMMVKFTNEYAQKKNRVGDISLHEMKCFVAVLLFSGYIPVPRKNMYWEQSADSHNSLVANAISRDRFKHIMSNIHVCQNDHLNKDDRFAKVRPLLDLVNKRCIAFIPHKQHHFIDESMVPYFGRHGAKQFIRGKPIRYGYKFWCGGPSSGYLAWCEPYQGAGTLPEAYASYGLRYGVIMTYADQLPKDLPYKLYFDNFFTSCDLLKDLQNERNICATGTLRLNRLDKACPLRDGDVLKKSERGTYAFCQIRFAT